MRYDSINCIQIRLKFVDYPQTIDYPEYHVSMLSALLVLFNEGQINSSPYPSNNSPHITFRFHQCDVMINLLKCISHITSENNRTVISTYRRRIICNCNEFRNIFSASSCFIALTSRPSMKTRPSPG